jgi:hypothetical protein
MFDVVNSSNGITVERNEKGVFKISGDFKVPFDELPKEKQKGILKLISETKKTES